MGQSLAPIYHASGSARSLEAASIAIDREHIAERMRPSPRRVLDDRLNLSVTEVAVMWILHIGTLPKAPRSLTLDIVEFYPVARNVISCADVVRDATGFDVRLIYFKGLIVARTHPTPQIVEAIRLVDRALGAGEPLVDGLDASAKQSAAEEPFEDQRALAHIADALGHSA